MTTLERAAIFTLHKVWPKRHIESGNLLARKAMRFMPRPEVPTSDRLKTEIAGLEIPNPIGLPAGFDKNADSIDWLLQAGFGFAEVGAVTPQAQPGNSGQRLATLEKEQGLLNRFGFPNEGVEAVRSRLARRPETGVIGINLGIQKGSKDKTADYLKVLSETAMHVDFATLNVSCPNTKGVQDMQRAGDLKSLLSAVNNLKPNLAKRLPVLIKISPDLDEGQIEEISGIALKMNVDGIVATNTTTKHEHKDIHDSASGMSGGLSGQPLFERSTQVLAMFAKETKGKIPIIGVGGVSTAKQAYDKIKAGASAVQLYTAIVYKGFSLVPKIAWGLDELLERDGFKSVKEAVGTETGKWL